MTDQNDDIQQQQTTPGEEPPQKPADDTTSPPPQAQPAQQQGGQQGAPQGSQQLQQRNDMNRRQPSRDRRNRPPRPRSQTPRAEQQHDGAKELSVVIPLYNEEGSLRELYDQLRSAIGKIGRYEIIFVDDGSTDGSMRLLHEIRHRDRRVKIIRFRRNFGKSAALSAGFAHAEGSFVVTMDADLQDDPHEIPNLLYEIKKGFDLVSGWKKKRRDPITKTIPSRFFNFVTSLLTGIHLHDFNCGLKIYKKEVVKEVQVYGELHRYIPVLASWLGFRVTEIPVQHRPRKYGKTKYGVGRFWKGFLDLLTVLFTTRYLQRPLHLFGFWGMIFVLLGCLVDGYLVFLKLSEGMSLSNRPLFLAGVLLIIVGVQIVSVGLLGELVTKSRHISEKEYSVREIWK
jgi:glycosyltransferase involved in cell wall biosynthesis